MNDRNEGGELPGQYYDESPHEPGEEYDDTNENYQSNEVVDLTEMNAGGAYEHGQLMDPHQQAMLGYGGSNHNQHISASSRNTYQIQNEVIHEESKEHFNTNSMSDGRPTGGAAQDELEEESGDYQDIDEMDQVNELNPDGEQQQVYYQQQIQENEYGFADTNEQPQAHQ